MQLIRHADRVRTLIAILSGWSSGQWRIGPEPTALACYGLLARSWSADKRRSDEPWPRCIDARPTSAGVNDVLT